MTDRQRAVIAALVGGLRKREASELTGVPERTLRDWMRRPHFLAELRRVRAAVWEATLAELCEKRRK